MSSAFTLPSPNKPLAPIWVGLAIFVFFPLGLFLLWRHPTLGRNGKWWAAGLAWSVLYLIGNANRPANDDTPRTTQDDSRPVVAERPAEEIPAKRSFWGPTVLPYKKRIDLCDKPEKYKNTEMKMEVLYKGGGIRQGEKLVSMTCVVFYGDGDFDMQFSIPKDSPQVRLQPGQYAMVTFVFSGDVASPSRVLKIERK